MSFAVDRRKTGLNCTRVSTLQLVRIQLFTFWQRRRLPLTNYIWHWKTGNWSKISRVSTLQEVLILLFSCWSCSRRPESLLTSAFRHIFESATESNSSGPQINRSGRTYPFFPTWSCPRRPAPLLILAFCIYLVWNCLNLANILSRQRVCIPLFSLWSCSLGPNLFSDDFWYGMKTMGSKSRSSSRFSKYVSRCFSRCSCSRRPMPFTNYLWHWKNRNWSKISRVSTLQGVRIPMFSIWSCPLRPNLFADGFLHGMKTMGSKSGASSRVSKYVSRCLSPWSCPAGPRHIADIFSWRPKPFLVVKCSTDSYFGISRLYLCSSWHLLSEKSSAWNPVHLDNADRMFISVCYFYFVTQTNCPEIDTLCTVSIDYRQKIF